jgi:hypothetical protein
MRLTVTAPFDHERHLQVPAVPGQTLGTWFQPHVYEHITACMVNGAFRDDWPAYEPQPTDHIRLYLRTGALFTLGATATIWGILATAAITAAVSTGVSIGLGMIMGKLRSSGSGGGVTPHQTEGKAESAFGISGRTNTTAQGTPKPLCYGHQRVYGHILTTRVALADEGRALAFGILYSLGEGPVASVYNPQIDDVDLAQFPGVEGYSRLGGADNAALIHADFATLSQVWSDGRQLPLAQPLIYQTRSSRTTKITLFLFLPFLRTAEGLAAGMHFQVEVRAINDPTWILASAAVFWSGLSNAGRFFPLDYTLPSANQWLVRITLLDTTVQEGVLPTLYDVMEEQDGNPLYPTLALLAIRGISSAQIQSFDAMRGSAMVQGRLVPVWNGTSFTTQWSQGRAWVLYDLLTEPRVGLGHRLDPSLIDVASFHFAQGYWDDQAGANVNIARDRCNVLINDRRPAWDWIKLLLGEARAALIPSQGLLKLVVDRPGEPGLLYSHPGNIVEGTVQASQGNGQGVRPNTIFVQFPDEVIANRPHLLIYREPGSESEPQREAPAVTLVSLSGYEHAYWMARYTLLRQRLVQRQVSWHSPLGALVSEPFDHVAVSYDTPNFARGTSGFLSSDSTVDRLVLDRLVTLEPGQGYTVLVRHQATNSMESRAVLGTGAVAVGVLLLTAPLGTVPDAGDLYALGVTNTALHHLVLEQVTQDGDQGWQLVGGVYAPTLYDYPVPPASPLPAPAPLSSSAGPPEAPLLEGVEDTEGGFLMLTWSLPAVPAGDSLVGFHVWFSVTDEVHFLFYGDIGMETTMIRTLTGQAPGWYAVRALSTLGGAGPLSNHFHVAGI